MVPKWRFGSGTPPVRWLQQHCFNFKWESLLFVDDLHDCWWFAYFSNFNPFCFFAFCCGYRMRFRKSQLETPTFGSNFLPGSPGVFQQKKRKVAENMKKCKTHQTCCCGYQTARFSKQNVAVTNKLEGYPSRTLATGRFCCQNGCG